MTVQLRAQQITIDLPRKTSEPWIHIVVQRCELDEEGNELNVVDRWGSIHKKLSDAATEIYPYREFAGVPDGHISVYGTSMAITSIARAWITQKYGGHVNARGEIVLD